MKNSKSIPHFLFIGLCCVLVMVFDASGVSAQSYPSVTLRYSHHLFSLDPDLFPSWKGGQEVWFYHGVEVLPPPSLRVDGDVIPPLPEGMEVRFIEGWNADAIAATLAERIAPAIDRPAGSVRILGSPEDGVTFEGIGLTGRRLDVHLTALLLIEALEQGVDDIHLVVEEIQPDISIEHASLHAMGIQEVVAVGESNFAHSTQSRRHNIATGLSKFNGHIIPQGEVFSFNEILGPVDASTGYLRELVILGDKTLPEYGGGLCQVSTTAYRGVWEYGFPIVDRRNHSFAVSYYSPQGTDATIYPPHTDMKFRNDSVGALLIQTYMEGDNAYFIYYGTRDNRRTEVLGPYIWNRRSPPPDKVEYTTDLPVGHVRPVGKAVSGMRAAWFRIVQPAGSTEEIIEPVYSTYEARPNFTQIGVASLQEAAPEIDEPSWLGE